MRIDLSLDAFYLMGSLWGILPGGSVCTSEPPAVSKAFHNASWVSQRGRPSAAAAFIDVNVVPMDTERVLAHQTVVVQDGRITALGPANKVSIPAGALRIDGRGRYLIPGLTDMHTHNYFGSGEYKKLAPRLFTLLTTGVTALRFFNSFGGDPQVFESAEVLSPRVYVSRTLEDLEKSAVTPDRVAADVVGGKAAGYDFIRIDASEVYDRGKSPITDSLLSAARRLGVPVVAHDHELSFGKMLALGTYGGSYEHLTSFRDTLGFRRAVYSDTLGQREAAAVAAKIPALASAVQRAGVWITPTLDCIERKYIPSPSNVVSLRQMVKAMQDAGVGLLMGAEGQYAPNELAALVGAGLSPYQALLTGTRNAAQHMGLLHESGTIALGKRADLVLLSGNPLADIRHTREPAGVMINGRWIDRAALDQRLLTWPKAWLRIAVMQGGLYPSEEQLGKLGKHLNNFEVLTDSLAEKSSGQGEASASRRIRQLLADQFGAIRAILTPEQHVMFDPKVRLWLREQARQGYPMTVPGILPISEDAGPSRSERTK